MSVVTSSVGVVTDLLDLDAAGVLVAAAGAVRRRRAAEVADAEVLLAWARLHAEDPTRGPGGPLARRVGNVLVQLGGEGTPGVQDFCLGEIALARGTGVTATRHVLADTLDLAHRLPATLAVCRSGDADLWVARRVARMCRHLPASAVGVVDTAVARIIDTEAAGRVLAVAEGKIVEADPALHDARVAAERQRRYVGLGRTDELGLRTLIARLEAGDAAAVDAVVHRVADILSPLHPDASPDALRAEAFGWLARPAELFRLLLEHTEPAEAAEPAAAPEDAEPDWQPARALAFPADLLDALRGVDLSPLRTKAVLYVHLHHDALHGHVGGATGGVARVESLGPTTLTRLRELLAGSVVTVNGVIDLHDRIRGTAYEHPESLRERVHLITGGDYWPYATSTSRAVDLDHPTPYDDTGPPGQTGTHNSGPLGRRHHRWKTHAGYTSRQAGDGRYVWLTPHGLGFLVDHNGTRPIDRDKAQMILDAPPGVDIYPG
jgi:hypothetical protein